MTARILIFTLGLFTTVAAAQTTQPAATTPPKNEATNAKPSSGDKLVDQTLDRMEARGKSAKAVEAQIQYDYITPGPIEDMEDKQTKVGTLLFVQTGTPQFLVHFTKKVQGGTVNRSPEYYSFDGLWLTERNDQHQTVIRREVVKPGQKVDLFDLGKGPFPLPFGRSRAEMLKYFEIRLQDRGSDDKPIKLRCLPRENTDLATRYRYVDLYVNRKLGLPTRVVCQRKIDDNRIEVSFDKIREEKTIDPKRFIVPIPDGFQVTTEPLEPPVNDAPATEMKKVP